MSENTAKSSLETEHDTDHVSQEQLMATVVHNIGNALTGMNSALRHTSQSHADLERVSAWLDGVQTDTLSKEQLQVLVGKLAGSLSKILSAADNPDNLQLNLGRLETGASHIKATINSYRDAKDSSQEKEHFQLQQTLQSALAMLDLSQTSVTLDCDPSIELHGPHNLFVQMLLNLFKNSLEAMRQRYDEDPKFLALLFIQVKIIDQAIVSLTVTDNGCGIPESARRKLFRQGYTSKTTGSGLGLSSVAHILSQFNGDIEITSAGHNQGTSIHISLPIPS